VNFTLEIRVFGVGMIRMEAFYSIDNIISVESYLI
jgi:hypothetical protein